MNRYTMARKIYIEFEDAEQKTCVGLFDNELALQIIDNNREYGYEMRIPLSRLRIDALIEGFNNAAADREISDLYPDLDVYESSRR